MRIILDAGHGGVNEKGEYVTAGKRSLHPVDGHVFYEGQNNRFYVQEMARMLTHNGYEVVYTVDPTEYTDLPLRERQAIANKYHAEKDSILISMHSNAGPAAARGYEVFTRINACEKSNQLAHEWIRQMQILSPNQPNRGVKTANFAMVRVNCPAILLEVAFHTNDDEVRLMRDWKYRQNVGLSILNTIKNRVRN